MIDKPVDRRQTQTDEQFIKEDLEQMSQAANYIQYQYEMFERFLGRRILEVGSGIGNFTRRIICHADLVVAIEPNMHCFQELSGIEREGVPIELIRDPLEKINLDAMKQKNLDTVLCLNVLEHIEDDARTVDLFHDVLIPGGRVILIVPSPEWAYGSIDKALGHFRRYSGKGLKAIVSKAGFKVVELRYFNPVGCLGWIWNARVTRRVAQSSFQIYVFDKYIVPVQKLLEKMIRFPFGQSLLIVGERTE